MINFIKTPYPCSYSKNEIHFKVNSDMYFNSVGAKPSCICKVNTTPDKGVFYRFKFINPETNKPDEFLFTTVDSLVYNSDAYDEIAYYGFVVFIPGYIDEWVEKFQKYPSANSWFNVSRISNDEFKIEAKYAREELKIEVETNQIASHLSFDIDNSFISQEIRPGYSMVAQIHYENDYLSGNFEMIARTECVLDGNAEADLDVSEILNAEIENGWSEQPIPKNGVNIFKPINLKRYYLVFTESWGNDVNLKKYTSEMLFVHWGGVSSDDAYIATPISLNRANYFLTFWPSGKKLLSNQFDWLSWMNKKEAGTFDVNVTIYTNVGSTTQTLHTIDVNKWETICFAVGFTQNDLQSIVPGETIQKWDFQVRKGAAAVSTRFYYYLDKFDCLRHQIIYFNSFGVCESVSTSGNWEEITNVSTLVAEKSKSFKLNKLLPSSFVFNSLHRNSFKTTTGLLSKEEAFKLQPILNALLAYVRENNTWRPVIVSTKKASVLKENEFLRRVEIELLRANDNDRSSFYDNKPDIELIQDCGITGFNVIDNELSLSSYGNLLVTKNGTTIQSIPWDGSKYPLAAKIIENGEYRASGIIDNMEIEKTFIYKRKRMSFSNSQTGAKAFSIRSNNPSETIYINWGEGDGFQSVAYTNSLTVINHTFTKTGKKEVIFEKPCFDDLVEFYALNNDLTGIDFSIFTGLETLYLDNSLNGSIYLSGLKNIKDVVLGNQNLISLKIGFQKELNSISLGSTNITTYYLDELIKELWSYRKFYSNTVTLNFFTLGYTPSALFTSIKDGTGIYAGEGLVSDYGWSITTT